MLRVMSLAVLVGAGAAAADCPRPVSEVAGVELVRSEPFFANVYRHSPEGLIETRVMERDGAEEKGSTIYIHPLAPGQQISANGAIMLDYTADASELDRLDQTGQWTSAIAVKIDGQVVMTGTAEKRFVGVDTVTIGDCRTDVWLVEDRMALGPSDGSYMLLSYAPDLGLVVRAVTMAADGKPLQGVEFDQIRVLAE